MVEITGPILITVTLLQSMHGTLPAELGPHSFGINEKSTTHFCVVLSLSGGDYRADSDHGDPLAVHARHSPGRARPSLVWHQQKSTTHFCVVLSLSGGDYRDRTGDLLHAMQALSRTTHSRTPTQRCEDKRYSALIRSIRKKPYLSFRI